jgi:C4-dicarboxylate transporter DctM subunit
MIMAILLGAYFLSFVTISIGLTRQINGFVMPLRMSPGQTLFAVIIFYVILGMFMETLSMMVATIPIVAPIVIGAGYDPVWFGILIILLIETAMITPPVGINLYVVQGIRPRLRIADVIVAARFAMIAILCFFQGLALWIPRGRDAVTGSVIQYVGLRTLAAARSHAIIGAVADAGG